MKKISNSTYPKIESDQSKCPPVKQNETSDMEIKEDII